MGAFTKFLILILLVIAGLFIYMPEGFFSVCNRTLTYDIGSIDAEFDTSAEEFLLAIQKAEAIWEDATGRDLFEYEPGAQFHIDLVFSEQQQKSLEWKSSQKTLSQINTEITESDLKYEALSAKYELQLSKYESDLQKHNDKVAYWNAQ